MAVLTMRRISVYGLKNQRKGVLEFIQRRGVVEVIQDVYKRQSQHDCRAVAQRP